MRLLLGLKILQQGADFAGIGGGVKRDQEDDREAGTVDVEIELRGAMTPDSALNGGDRLGDARVLRIGVALEEDQSNQGPRPHATVVGGRRREKRDPFLDGRLNGRTFRRQCEELATAEDRQQ